MNDLFEKPEASLMLDKLSRVNLFKDHGHPITC